MRILLGALPVVLLLVVAPSAAFAESLVCHPVRRGESATQAARRLTGDGRNTYRASFQIMNHSSRFIPKSQYDRIRAGWRACVIRPAVGRSSSNAESVTALEAPDATDASDVSAASEAFASNAAIAAAATGGSVPGADNGLRSVASGVMRTIGRADLTIVWLGTAMVVPWFGWLLLGDYLARRRTRSIVMRHFAHRFVSEFERPLVRETSAERPVRSRLRRSARQGRFDILLAPNKGRRYPNLSDHKKNVEYDVARVMRVLADDSFVSGPLYVQAGWVVVPFRFEAGPKQAGVTCISSL